MWVDAAGPLRCERPPNCCAVVWFVLRRYQQYGRGKGERGGAAPLTAGKRGKKRKKNRVLNILGYSGR